jgi:hypothetical protein
MHLGPVETPANFFALESNLAPPDRHLIDAFLSLRKAGSSQDLPRFAAGLFFGWESSPKLRRRINPNCPLPWPSSANVACAAFPGAIADLVRGRLHNPRLPRTLPEPGHPAVGGPPKCRSTGTALTTKRTGVVQWLKIRLPTSKL